VVAVIGALAAEEIEVLRGRSSNASFANDHAVRARPGAWNSDIFARAEADRAASRGGGLKASGAHAHAVFAIACGYPGKKTLLLMAADAIEVSSGAWGTSIVAYAQAVFARSLAAKVRTRDGVHWISWLLHDES